MNYLMTAKTKENHKLIEYISKSLLGAGGLSVFMRVAKEIKFCRNYNDANYCSLRDMISGYEGMAMASALWPWEFRRADTVQEKKEQFLMVMLYLGVTIQEVAVLLEGNPRHNE